MTSDAPTTRQRILDAFGETYDATGPADVDVIAAAAGVSRSTVYRHFAHTGEMLDAVRHQGLTWGTRLMERFLAPALRGDEGADLLGGVTELVGEILREGVPFARLLRLDAGADDAIQEQYGRLAEEVIRKAQREGTIAAHLDPMAVYVASVSLCRGLVGAVDQGRVTAAGAEPVAAAFFEALRPR